MATLRIIALSKNDVLAGVCIAFVVFAFFQLLTGKYVGKAKSILPPSMEAKRISIATKHNQIVSALVLFVVVALFSIVVLLHNSPRIWTLLAIIVVGLVEFFAIRRVFKYDEQMCNQLGFTCPLCGKPLYEPRSFININGKCPKCGQSVVPDQERSPTFG